MRRRIFTVAIAVLLTAAIGVSPAFAGLSTGGGRSTGGGGGGGAKSSGSVSKTSGGSKAATSGGGSSKSYSSSKPATAASPKSYSTSKGSVAPAPKVMTKVIPPAPRPPRSTSGVGGAGGQPRYVPPSANYTRDRALLMTPQYRTYWVSNNPHFYGDATSPFFYLWLAGAFDNNSDNRPPLPAANAGQVNVEMIPTLLGVIDAEVKTAEGS